MKNRRKALILAAVLIALALVGVTPSTLWAQAAPPGAAATSQWVSFPDGARQQALRFYGQRDARSARPLPPGIRKKLDRGRPLPPGIAKKVAPAPLARRLGVPDGFQLLEAGTNLLLVEAATGLVHDLIRGLVS